ncbi:MAG: hypothetical protein DA330_04550 [Nitrososphaera sp.]|nr:hypothetical protein [Nitrososphaera sp.]
MKKLPLEVRGTIDNFVPFYKKLDETGKLYQSIADTIELIRWNPTLGNHVEHDKIPSYYIKKFKITNLFRIELIAHWRLLYAVHSFSDVGIGILILEALDHKKYDLRFGYN